MPNVYYVNSLTGSDANNGRSPDAPLASIDAVEKLVLKPGDQVLFARGASFEGQLDIKKSGTVDSPITFGAYGEGEPPQIHGGAQAIFAVKVSNIIIEDIALSGTPKNALYAQAVDNFVLDNVTVTGSGPHGSTVGISIQASSNVTVKNSTITDVKGDGIWIDGVKGITIEKNLVRSANGHTSDAVQIENSTRVVVRGNELDMTGASTSKGALVVNHSKDVLIEGNEMIGGGFGASVNSHDVAIIGNEIYGQGGYNWSFGIGIGEIWDVGNYLISENYVHDVRFGVAISGTNFTAQRTDIDVIGNIFDDIRVAALKVDRAATGQFYDNVIDAGSKVMQIAKVGEGFTIGVNRAFVNTDPTANEDRAALAEAVFDVQGNLLANDTSLIKARLLVDSVEQTNISGTTHVAGKYGTLTVNRDGTYTYNLDADKVKFVNETTTERFSYIVTDGHNKAQSYLELSVSPRPNDAPIATADLVKASGGVAAGNVLTNDTDADGNALQVKSLNGVTLNEFGALADGAYGKLKINADGSFSYTVDNSKLKSIEASNAFETFKYTAFDGRAASESTLTVALADLVGPKVNIKPVVTSDRAIADSRGNARGNVLDNDYDLDGGKLSVTSLGSKLFAKGANSLVLEGKYGSITIDKSGNYVYDFNDNVKLGAGQSVTESFLYKVIDGTLSNAAYLSVVINADDLAI